SGLASSSARAASPVRPSLIRTPPSLTLSRMVANFATIWLLVARSCDRYSTAGATVDGVVLAAAGALGAVLRRRGEIAGPLVVSVPGSAGRGATVRAPGAPSFVGPAGALRVWARVR